MIAAVTPLEIENWSDPGRKERLGDCSQFEYIPKWEIDIEAPSPCQIVGEGPTHLSVYQHKNIEPDFLCLPGVRPQNRFQTFH